MGCCFSSSKKHHHQNPPPRSTSNSRAPPPPPPLEEETVKEVLSETPIIPKPHHPAQEAEVLVNDKKVDFSPQVKNDESTAIVKPSDEILKSTAVIKPEVSEETTSEMCSFTESYSTTTTAAEKRDDDGEVTQKSPIRVYRKRQNSGHLAGARRLAPSPEKRRSPSAAAARGIPQRRNVGPPRRGTGEYGLRRSKSPATRGKAAAHGNVRFRSPAAREEEKLGGGGQSPARQGENEGGGGGSSSKTEKAKEEVPPESGESLENPLVSLECFIFL